MFQRINMLSVHAYMINGTHVFDTLYEHDESLSYSRIFAHNIQIIKCLAENDLHSSQQKKKEKEENNHLK